MPAKRAWFCGFEVLAFYFPAGGALAAKQLFLIRTLVHKGRTKLLLFLHRPVVSDPREPYCSAMSEIYSCLINSNVNESFYAALRMDLERIAKLVDSAPSALRVTIWQV